MSILAVLHSLVCSHMYVQSTFMHYLMMCALVFQWIPCTSSVSYVHHAQKLWTASHDLRQHFRACDIRKWMNKNTTEKDFQLMCTQYLIFFTFLLIVLDTSLLAGMSVCFHCPHVNRFMLKQFVSFTSNK